MSFLQYKASIEEGDTVIVCRGREKSFAVEIQSGHVIQVKGGAVHHSDVIGKSYGSKVLTSNGKTWVQLLHPTPELWTVTLPHRTQILYSTDIAIIALQLGLRPGSVVVESGTGSGSLSHAFARTIAPTGHLHTFEFHVQRAEIARREFMDHALGDVVTVTCRDVCSEGFALDAIADAVFLDLPNPWEAIKSAKLALKATGGRLCSFSPCMEQVQRTSEKLQECGFTDIDVLECLLRPYDVHQFSLSVPNMGFMPSPTELSGDSHVTSSEGHVTAGPPAKKTKPTLCTTSMYTAQPTKAIPGHTGFLTFATLTSKRL